MRVVVMGSAAGGGFPQWNCGCANCDGVRTGRLAATPRTQESVAVTGDGRSFVLLNASPDLRLQIEALPALRPRAARDTPIAAVVLTSGEIDHCAGLFSLREAPALAVYATERVWRGLLEGNVLARGLGGGGRLVWRRLALDGETVLADADGRATGLTLATVAVAGKPPRHLEATVAPHPEDVIGLRLHGGGAGLAYVPCAAAVTAAVHRLAAGAGCLFFDGTFWSADELAAHGLGTRRAREMGHVPLGGADGALARLAGLAVARRILIHVNNTNPLLDPASPARRAADAAGWEVAYDGMELAP